MKLYGFFRSGTSHRLRIALNLKGIAYEQVPIDLRIERHLSAEYKAINPQQLVPSLDTGEALMTQTPAIIERLEARFHKTQLLSVNTSAKARIRALTSSVSCDIHPIKNRTKI